MRRRLDGQTIYAILTILVTSRLGNALSLPTLPVPQDLSSNTQRVWRRQPSAKHISSPISIAPSQYFEGNDGPWSSFPIQVGSGDVGGLQDVRVMISTAATAIWTIGAEGCPSFYGVDCAQNRGGLFLRNQSLSWISNSIYETGLEINLGLDSSGYAGFDKTTLGWQGSGGPTVDRSMLWNLADSNYWLGIFGLNPRPTNFTTFNDPQTSFLQTLANNKKIPSVSWAYTAGNQYRLDKVFGSLTLGGYDSNRFVPNDVSFDFYPDISRDLSVNLQSIKADKTSPSNLLPDGSISIFIDSTVAELWLPASACAAFEKAFGIEFNTDSHHYIISSQQRQTLLAQNAQITFTLGPKMSGGKTVDITLPYQALDLQLKFPIVVSSNTTTYYFPLQKAANDTQYTLGRAFLQEAYLIYDYERQNFSVSQCSWDRKKLLSQKLVGILSPSAKSTSSNSKDNKHAILTTGAIIGIAIGVAGLVIILILVLVLLRRRKQLEKRRIADLKAQSDSEASQAELRAKLETSHRLGGELGADGVYELPPDPKKFLMPEMAGRGSREVRLSKLGYSEVQAQEYFGHGKGFANEMPTTHTSVYEMPGSEVQEVSVGRRSRMTEGGWI